MTGEPQRYYREVVLAYDGDECLIWPYATSIWGYGNLWIDGRSMIVSRIVCEEANGPAPSPIHEAAHSCGKGHLGCVAKKHMSWKTPTENQADKIVHGTTRRGDRNRQAKLTEPDVRHILAMKGVKSNKELARQFGVAPATIGAIHRRETWGWLELAA